MQSTFFSTGDHFYGGKSITSSECTLNCKKRHEISKIQALNLFGEMKNGSCLKQKACPICLSLGLKSIVTEYYPSKSLVEYVYREASAGQKLPTQGHLPQDENDFDIAELALAIENSLRDSEKQK